MGITFLMLSNKKFNSLRWSLAPRLPGMMVWSEDRGESKGSKCSENSLQQERVRTARALKSKRDIKSALKSKRNIKSQGQGWSKNSTEVVGTIVNVFMFVFVNVCGALSDKRRWPTKFVICDSLWWVWQFFLWFVTRLAIFFCESQTQIEIWHCSTNYIKIHLPKSANYHGVWWILGFAWCVSSQYGFTLMVQ